MGKSAAGEPPSSIINEVLSGGYYIGSIDGPSDTDGSGPHPPIAKEST